MATTPFHFPPGATCKNTDYLAGYETGLKKGLQRSGGKLVNRKPPQHLYDSHRWMDWDLGYRDGLLRRREDTSSVMVTWMTRDGRRHQKLLRGNPSRGRVVTRLMNNGAAGDVRFIYDNRVVTASI